MPRKTSKKLKGGSPASKRVMDLVKDNGATGVPYPKPYQSVISKTDVLSSYGSIYKTTGGSKRGKKQRGGVKVNDFVSRLVDNRALDLYLKYMGIKTLTTATLVPFALIMGRDKFAGVIKSFVKGGQKGGAAVLQNKIPFLDDPLLGAYLKIAGLSTLTLSPATLVPIGILMAIYEMFDNTQKGGRVLFPPKYFRPEAIETYVVEPPSTESFSIGNNKLVGKSFPYTNLYPFPNAQKGGIRLFTGASIPPDYFQRTASLITGQPLSHGPYRSLPYVNNDMQLNCSDGSCGRNVLSSSAPEPIETTPTEVTGMPNLKISTQKVDPVNQLTYQGLGEYSKTSIPSPQAGGKKNRRRKQKSPKRKNKRGGGSDWIGSQYSRGSYTASNMPEGQFRMFNKSSPYMTNVKLANGAANCYKPSPHVPHQTLFEQSPHNGVPTGFGYSVPAKSGGRRKTTKRGRR